MNIAAKKSLGQNFLTDESVLNAIINSVNVSDQDLIIEIGPGKGALTKKLKKFNCDLIAFELDERLVKILKELEDEKTKIIFGDFLKVNLDDYLKKKYKKIHVIANIPYYITNLIIRKLIQHSTQIDDITLMVQKEVAMRLASAPNHKSYGALTIFSNIDYTVTKVIDVSKHCFSPVPKVDSTVVQFNKRPEKLLINDIEVFSKLVNDSFKNKRKTLRNNLSNYDWLKILSILRENGFDDNVRAEQIPIETFAKVSNSL